MDREHEATVGATDTSQMYIGQWNRLISTTNWEKGRIIHEWRGALMEGGAVAMDHSDESWSRMVGGVSSQHTGRLRRVHERFGEVFTEYEGLYWSHFQASLDWDDAEMWLEGAVQSQWSVAGMRRQRWEATGAVAAEEPYDADIVSTEVDEDFTDHEGTGDRAASDGHLVAGEHTAEALSPAGPDFGDEEDVPSSESHPYDGEQESRAASRETSSETVRPFEDLAELPDDISSAFEAFQLAILRHKSERWQEITRDDVIASLDALKALALAPAE